MSPDSLRRLAVAAVTALVLALNRKLGLGLSEVDAGGLAAVAAASCQSCDSSSQLPLPALAMRP